VLTDYGVQEKNILLSDTCTKCNSDVFFSYRGDMGKTGSLAAIMMLRETI
jgi:polyphenol oxidase